MIQRNLRLIIFNNLSSMPSAPYLIELICLILDFISFTGLTFILRFFVQTYNIFIIYSIIYLSVTSNDFTYL